MGRAVIGPRHRIVRDDGADPSPRSSPLDDHHLLADLAGTVAFVLTSIAATIWIDTFATAAAVVALGLFFAGCVLFLMAFVRAVDRSRFESIGIGGLYFLAGSAPARIRRWFIGLLSIQVVVAVVTASVRVFTELAFGVLVPMWGLGLAGRWASLHGDFATRAPDLKRPGRRGRDRSDG